MKNKGFTLVELMVVVAIIGISSSVAIPSFKKYQARSRTVEARHHLANIYVAQTAFYADYNTYATCLKQMGYDPSEEKNNRYYAIGFENSNNTLANAAVQNGAASTCINGVFKFGAGKRIGTIEPIDEKDLNAKNTPGKWVATDKPQGFRAGALGIISSDSATPDTADAWSIDEKKNFTHERVGY